MSLDYSKAVRKMYKYQINSTLDVITKQLHIPHMPILDEFSYEVIIGIICNTTNSENIDNVIYSNNETKVLLILCACQLYTDTYKRLNYLDKMGIIDEPEKIMFESLKNLKDYDELLIFLSKHSVDTSLCLMRYDDLAAYDKVLEMKALSDEDIERINRFNPIFMMEYNKYNVHVDEVFIARQIKNWLKSFNNDYEKSYLGAVSFIKNYTILNPSLKESLEKKYPGATLMEVVKNFYDQNDAILELKK